MNKKRVLIVIVFILFLCGVGGYLIIKSDNNTPYRIENSDTASSSSAQKTDSESFNKNLYELDKPGSPWWVVNKKRPLPAGYVPADLAVPNVRLRLARTAPQMPFSLSATTALEEMFMAAKQEGIELVFGSGYRSEELQRQFYNQYVAQDGQAAADRYSARPGTSEHQTGLSFDATSVTEKCHLEICFQDTPEGKWLSANAYKYGFIVRYPDGKETITGYQYEPWHLRYVGKELATEMRLTSILTLEEFFNLPPAPSYD